MSKLIGMIIGLATLMLLFSLAPFGVWGLVAAILFLVFVMAVCAHILSDSDDP
jgi:predicted PurR-regulated permease PerM